MTSHGLVYLDFGELSATKQRLHAGDFVIEQAVSALTNKADTLLEAPPTSVFDKTSLAASGNPHDFYAIGGYSWPDENSADGLPYRYRDSETNPEATTSRAFDKGNYEEMTRRVATLSLAHFYTDDERYALRAALLLRVWFLDPATQMSPHFRYAAARPGVWDGHFSGVIEGVYLIELLDYVKLLQQSQAWTSTDDTRLRRWFGELATWLADSRFGRREMFSLNNHGSYLLAQVATFSLYSGNILRARKAIKYARWQIKRQIEPDGRMIRELERADGWFYSIYGLRAFAVLARIAEQVGEELWNGPNGRLAQSCATMSDYLAGSRPWPFTRGSKPWEHDATQLLHLCGRAYGSRAMVETGVSITAHAQEAWIPCSLLGLEGVLASRAERELPAPADWPVAVNKRLRARDALRTWFGRAQGVLASRGRWPMRRLR